MEHKFVYRNVVEGIFVKAYRDEFDTSQLQSLRELGIDLEKLRATYPQAIFEQAINRLREWKYPTQTDDEAFRDIGRRMVAGYLDTAMGRVLKLVLAVLSPDLMVKRTPQNVMTGNNFIQCTCTQIEERHYRIWCSELTAHPGLLAGTLLAGLEMVGARNVVVTSTDRMPAVTYEVRWTK